MARPVKGMLPVVHHPFCVGCTSGKAGSIERFQTGTKGSRPSEFGFCVLTGFGSRLKNGGAVDHAPLRMIRFFGMPSGQSIQIQSGM